LTASVAVVLWSATVDTFEAGGLVLFLGIAVLVGAVAYTLGFITFALRSSNDWGCLSELILLAIAFLLYYVIVASVCRYIILPVVFLIAGISRVRIPPVFGK